MNTYTSLRKSDSAAYDALRGEMKREEEGLELIASENAVSEAVLDALGSVFTNKYSEGYPGNRYYGGQDFTDVIETLAIDRVKRLFGAEHANVQPLSGASANLAAYAATLSPGDTVLGMDLSHGGHLTHGHPVTLPAKVFRFVRYKTEADGTIDYDKLEALAKKEKPKLMLAGFSSYTRQLDYERFASIAKKVGAISMMDMAHIAGMIAGKALPSPVPFFDIVTATTHKTLRGPRGGLILCKEAYAKAIDKAVFPGVQGGPHMHMILAKAVAFGEALRPEFRRYAKQVLVNAKALEKEFLKLGYEIVFGKTENHMLLIDTVKSRNVTGKEAQAWLDLAGISLNKNVLPDDPRGPLDPSGIRVGVPAVTTRGMKVPEMRTIARLIDAALRSGGDEKTLSGIRRQVKMLCKTFPIYR
ncbi:MAG: serine hydroxymethyltransferase [Candidatus Moranbacteria bacterium]|nr:serine hydroxymethyltransferase [Candidatus Moranbacteria bacterium]